MVCFRCFATSISYFDNDNQNVSFFNWACNNRTTYMKKNINLIVDNEINIVLVIFYPNFFPQLEALHKLTQKGQKWITNVRSSKSTEYIRIRIIRWTMLPVYSVAVVSSLEVEI